MLDLSIDSSVYLDWYDFEDDHTEAVAWAEENEHVFVNY